MPFDHFNRVRRSARGGARRSQLEEAVEYELDQLGYQSSYESDTFTFTTEHSYTPDYKIHGEHPFFIEVKGWMSPEMRSNLLAAVMSNPTIPLLIAFQQPNQRISKRSKTTVAQWASKHGIPWTPIPIPRELLMSWANGQRCTSPVPSARAVTRRALTRKDGSTASAVATEKDPRKGDK